MPRTRSTVAHKKVVDAAVMLFAERGIAATSMDAIAETSGVSKATIYKHWADKDALAMEVLSHVHGLDQEPPVFDSGDLRRDLLERLRYQPGADQPLKDKLWPHVMAYSATNPVFGDAWRARVIEPARTGLTGLIERGQKQGLLKRSLDPEIGVAMLFGPLLYTHVFIQRLGRVVPAKIDTTVVDAFLNSFETARSRQRRRG